MPPIVRRSDIGTAALASIGALAGSFAVAGSTPEFVVAPVNRFVVNTTPAEVIAFSIQTLGHLGEQLALALSFVLTIVLLAVVALVGIVAGRYIDRQFAPAVAVGTAVWAATALLTGLPVAALAAGVPAGTVVGALTAWPVDVESASESTMRRRVLGAVGGVLGFGLFAYLLGNQRTMPPRERMPTPPDARRLSEQARDRQFDFDTIPGLVSPIEEFYEVDINSIDPMVDADSWTLSITGAVDEPRTISYEELRAMPAETKYDTLRCVGEGLNARLLDNAIWTGVPVGNLVEDAGPQSGCECVMLRAADGYFEQFPLAALERGFLAYGMNGQSLPRGHGYPLRALIPGHWGEINVKWLTEIEVLDERADGYWERRGWHGTGPVNTVAKIWTVDELDDGAVRVAGHAYAGTRGIDRVEVSTDGGTTWADATLSDPLDEADVLGGRDVWRQWQYTWTPEAGEQTVLARATDGTGMLQPREEQSPFPSGASGWVSVTVSG